MDKIQITINKSAVFKRCNACGVLFPSHVLNINSYCAKHQKEFKRALLGFIVNRLVPVDTLDVFDKDGLRLCRSCGRPMYRKDGKRSHHMRNCHKKDCNNLADVFWSYYQMPSVIAHIIRERRCSEYEVQCEECGKQMHIGSHYHTYEIHHKKPVYRTTVEDWEDVWDPNNLIILCMECHNRTKVYKIPVPIVVREKRKTKQLPLFN